MINIGFNIASLLGFLDIGLAGFFLISTISQIIRRSQTDDLTNFLLLLQAILIPPLFLLVGGILIFQGWRLDPILQFAFFLMNLMIIFLGLKDILNNRRH